ncbi:hypothetical protein niasHT_019895 [Heterodera trifolii]|uniref:Uncharacterized protein n=1 Tax=Heterodera trifolii TaxID=157864 RepID=A0ABD2L424_9BILA
MSNNKITYINDSFSSDFVRLRRVHPTANFVSEGFAQSNGAFPPAEVPSTKLDNESERNGGGKGLHKLLRDESIKCACHVNDYPPWTGEALYSKCWKMKAFWSFVLVLCTLCGAFTTYQVIEEYSQGKTATSNTIRLVPNLSLPAITVCPKVPDALKGDLLYQDMRAIIPHLTKSMADNLIKYWIGGSGLENMNELSTFNASYLEELDDLYQRWRQNSETKTFFQKIQDKYGYKCTDFFKKCELGGQKKNCCKEIFNQKAVMRRGFCYQTREGLNQEEADDIGRLVLEIKELPSITSPHFGHKQPQTVIYINDNFEEVLDFPRFYLYQNEWNRMHITARRIELLEHPNDCTNKVFGKDSNCIVRNWLSSTVIDHFNCTLPYLDTVRGISPELPTCEPLKIAKNYTDIIQLVHSGSVHGPKCIPGCNRWEYSVSLQQSPSLQDFANYTFNLEVSFYDLQYEHLKEVVTITVPGFMSQIGGQFGFFLGLSIITVIQMASFAVWSTFRTVLFLGNRRKFDWVFSLNGISLEKRAQEIAAEKSVNVGQLGNSGESITNEITERRERVSNREVRGMTKRRSKSEKDEETTQKRRLKLIKQQSFDEGGISKC